MKNGATAGWKPGRAARDRALLVAAACCALLWIGSNAINGLWRLGADSAMASVTTVAGGLALLFAFTALFQRLEAARRAPDPASGLGVSATFDAAPLLTRARDIQLQVAKMIEAFDDAQARADELETRVRAGVSSLAAAAGESRIVARGLAAEMAAASKDMTAAIHLAGAGAVAGIAARAQSTNETLDAAAEALIAKIDQAGARASRAIDAVSSSAREHFGEKTRETLANWVNVAQFASQKFAVAANEAAAVVADGSRTLSGTVDSRLAAFEETLRGRGGEVVNTLAERTGEIEARWRALETEFASGAAKTGARASERLRDIDATLAALARKIDQDLAARGGALAETLAKSTDEAARALAEGGRGVLNEIDANAAAATRSLEAKIGALTLRLSDLVERVPNALQGKFEAAAGALDSGATRLQSEVLAPLEAVAARLHASGADLAAAASGHSRAIEGIARAHDLAVQRHFAEEGKTLSAVLGERTRALRLDLAGVIAEADATLATRGDDIAGRIEARIDALRRLLEGEGAEFVARLEARGEQVSTSIASVGERSVESFERKVTGLIALLTRRGDDLLSAMNAGASESARRVAALNAQLGREVDAAVTGSRADAA